MNDICKPIIIALIRVGLLVGPMKPLSAKERKIIDAIIAMFWTCLQWKMYPCDGAVRR